MVVEGKMVVLGQHGGVEVVEEALVHALEVLAVLRWACAVAQSDQGQGIVVDLTPGWAVGAVDIHLDLSSVAAESAVALSLQPDHAQGCVAQTSM